MNAQPEDLQTLLRQIVAQETQSRKTAHGPLTSLGADWLAGHYLAAVQAELAATDSDRRWECLRAFVQDWSRLRRCEFTSARVQISRDRLILDQANIQARKEKEFRQWLKRPDIRDELFPKEKAGLSPETIAKIEKELNLF